jgi:DNA-binding phage protein
MPYRKTKMPELLETSPNAFRDAIYNNYTMLRNVGAVAKQMGIARSQLYRCMEKLNITMEDLKKEADRRACRV